MKNSDRYRTSFGCFMEELIAEKSRRLGRQVSLNELCFRASVDVSNVWRSMYTAEREGRPPSSEILRRLAPHLPISYTDLLRASGHTDLAEAISTEEVLESRIESDPTLAPDLKMQLKTYLQFLRKAAPVPRFA